MRSRRADVVYLAGLFSLAFRFELLTAKISDRINKISQDTWCIEAIPFILCILSKILVGLRPGLPTQPSGEEIEMKNLQRRLAVRILFAVGAVAFAACGSSAGEDRSREKVRLKETRLGDTKPVHAFGNLYLAGQPSPEDLPLLKAEGIKTVISLRHKKELAWDEASAVEQNGMKFVPIPFGAAQQLKPEVFDKVLKILRDKKQGPVVLHCGSANRVGAIWYAYRVLDGQLSPEAAKKEAQKIGLRTPAYLDRAQEYVKAVQKAEEKPLPVGP